MAGTIGSVSCDILRGRPRGLKERIDVWVIPGYEGYGAQQLGKNESSFRFRAVKFGTAEDIETWITDIEALQGTIVTIVNDWGDSFADLLITRMGAASKRPAPPTYEARGEIELEGVRTKVPV